ncbi:MAG: RNA 3'-terminal phosphate cyclase [Phycisphaerales bacterium]|nr:MAG: RNA 3'-terminal phosphate cyclase [Phycisphaerales bacterium]
METVLIDGSMGAGGGQVLRTSLALSCITGKHLRIENIRAARRNPGLARQHLSCVRAASQICGGQSDGNILGSQVLDFKPGPIRGGDYSFDIGSAGSASLVVQTILPALFLADEPSTVTVTGGTHNPWAPPFDFLAETFLPAVASAGFHAECELIKHGFYPAGGGMLGFKIQPWQRQSGGAIDLCERAANPQVRARIYTARLPGHIAHRQQELLCQSGLRIANMEHIDATDSDGPGNCAMLRVCSGGRTTVFTAFGQKGKPSKKVVGEVVTETRDYLSSDAAIDRHLADQLLIYMAMKSHFAKDGETGALSDSRQGGEKPAPAKAGGSYTTNDLSTHLTTNIETIRRFLPINYSIESQDRIHRISCMLV